MNQDKVIEKLLKSADNIEDEAQRVEKLLTATNQLGPDRADGLLCRCEAMIDEMDDPELQVALYSKLVTYQDRVETRRNHTK